MTALNPEDKGKGNPTTQMSPTVLSNAAAPDRAVDPGEMGEDPPRLGVQLASEGDGLLVLEEAVDDGSVIKTAGTLFLSALEVTYMVYSTQSAKHGGGGRNVYFIGCGEEGKACVPRSRPVPIHRRPSCRAHFPPYCS